MTFEDALDLIRTAYGRGRMGEPLVRWTQFPGTAGDGIAEPISKRERSAWRLGFLHRTIFAAYFTEKL